MMIWKNDTGLPFTEIRRACCAAGGKNIRVKENLENKRSQWKQTATIRKGWVARKADKGLVTSRETGQLGSSKEGRACWLPGNQIHSAPLKLLRDSRN